MAPLVMSGLKPVRQWSDELMPELELDELLVRPELEELLDELEEARPELDELEELDDERPELEVLELEELELELEELELDVPAGPLQAASAKLTNPIPMSDNESEDPLNNFIFARPWFFWEGGELER
jgi:hypothetical protein